MARDYSAFAALAAVGSAGLAIGLSFPLMSLNLDDWGVDAAGIGAFTLAAAISTVVATPFVPPLLARLPVRVVIGGALAVIAAAYLINNVVREIPVWFATRFAAGMAYSFLFVSAEAWILERTKPERRGFILGLFAAVFAGAMASGGLLIGIFGHRGSEPFLIGAAIPLLGLLAMALPGPSLTAPEGSSGSPRALLSRIKAAPIVMLAPLAMGAIETAKYNLIPIYARRVGFSDDMPGLMIAAAGIGVLVLQPLMGALGDKLGAPRTLMICSALGAALPLAIAGIGAQPQAALVLIFFYSGVVTGLYTIGLTAMAKVFRGGELAAGNAAFALCYGVGQLVGPGLAGFSFGAAGPAGFMMTLAAFSMIYLAFLTVHTLRRPSEP